MKNNSFSNTLLLIVLISVLAVADTRVSTVNAATSVSGIINSDTTWTKADSPYSLTDDLAIAKEVILTIEPGVTVNLNKYYILVNGTLTARGTSTNKITLNAEKEGYISFSSSSNGWNSQTGTGCIIEKATINTVLYTSGSSVMIYDNYLTKGVGLQGGSPIVAKNTFNLESDNLFSNNHAIAIGNENTALIVDNTISRAFERAAIEVGNGSPTIMRNQITNTYGYMGDSGYWQSGILISEHASPIIKNNTITQCANGIYYASTSMAEIVGNNFERISGSNLYMASNVNPDVANNWWGTTNGTVITQKIHDTNKDFDYSTINYTPFLTEANPKAMPDPNAPIPTTNSSAILTETQLVVIAVLAVAGSLVAVAVLLRRRNIFQKQPNLQAQ